MRFDYLHASRPLLLQRLLDIRIPDRFQAVLFAVTGGALAIAGACGIEAHRLHQALTIESVYRQRCDEERAALSQQRVYYERVQTLVQLDKRVRTIRRSGATDARILAEIANNLPEHAWLMGISHSGTGLVLDGRARNLEVLSAVIHGLMRAKDLGNPSLVSTALDGGTDRDTMRYEIRLNESRP